MTKITVAINKIENRKMVKKIYETKGSLKSGTKFTNL